MTIIAMAQAESDKEAVRWRLTAVFHDCASCVHNPVCSLKDEKSKLESAVYARA